MTGHRASARRLLIALMILAHAAPVSAITAEEFRLRSGADLVALCAAAASEPLYTAAIHMCHGFGAGVFQAITTLTRHEKLQPLLCPPEPSPSRNETVRRFLEWAQRNPQHLGEPAVAVAGRFFITEFPCRPR
jgi:hypothetical protein